MKKFLRLVFIMLLIVLVVIIAVITYLIYKPSYSAQDFGIETIKRKLIKMEME